MQFSRYSPEFEDNLNTQFIQRVIDEVTVSCALPMSVPTERIPEFILQAAQWFWLNDDGSAEERMYLIPNKEICKNNTFNKIIQLPEQIIGVYGVQKTNSVTSNMLGDFSVDRMMLSTYSMYGGAFGGGGGNTGTIGSAGFSVVDVAASLYEVDTYNQFFNSPITFNFNKNSRKLVLLGDLAWNDIIIQAFRRTRIVDLFNNYYFFRWCVCLVKRALGNIYGTMEFALPGGVTLNYSNFTDQAESEMEEIKEWIKDQHSADYFFQSNTI